MAKTSVYPALEQSSVPSAFHDLTCRVSGTFSQGTANPFFSKEVTPDDSITYGFSGRLESFPMIAPCLDGFKFRTSYYFSRLSNFYGWIDNNSKLNTQQFVESGNFWSYIPLVSLAPNLQGSLCFDYPVDGSSQRPASTAWMSPALASCIYRNGVAPGSLLNTLGVPAGFNGAFVDPTDWYAGGLPYKFDSDSYAALRLNLHKVFAYMDAYRVSLLNLQERNCYYIGVVPVDTGYCYTAAGEKLRLVDLGKEQRNLRYDYGYKAVSVRSLDSFMMFLRYYTSNASYTPSGDPLNLNLANVSTFKAFLVACCNYLLHAEGLNISSTPSVFTSEALSSLSWFLEVTGLALCLSSDASFVPYTKLLYRGTTALTPEDDLSNFLAATFGPCVQNSGYFLTTFEMDLNRGVLSTDVGITRSSVDTSKGSFTIDAFRFANSVQKMIDRFDVSGGRFSSWLRSLWRVQAGKSTFDTAELLHVTSSFIGNTDILSTAATADASLAQQAGYAIGEVNSQRDHFTSDMYGIFMAIGSLVPVVTYSQGISPSDSRLSIHDCFMPQYANIGFQDVPAREFTAQVSTLPSGSAGATVSESVGDLIAPDLVVARRPAWQDYRTSLDYSFGNFVLGAALSYWTLGRAYNDVNISGCNKDGNNDLDPILDPDVNDARFGIRLSVVPNSFRSTTYIFPRLYNYLFAVTDDSAQNFRISGTFTYKGKRNIPAPQMPSL